MFNKFLQNYKISMKQKRNIHKKKHTKRKKFPRWKDIFVIDHE